LVCAPPDLLLSGELKLISKEKGRTTLKSIRQLHLYLGMFLAPTVILFAASGALQIFRLQEGHPGSSYQPPSWIVFLAGVHKDQRLEGPPPPRPAAPAVEAAPAPKPAAPPEGQPAKSKRSTILMWFFMLAAVGIITSTVLGIVMAFKYNRARRVIWALLAAGTLLPILMLFL
jgi:hypothetical protein